MISRICIPAFAALCLLTATAAAQSDLPGFEQGPSLPTVLKHRGKIERTSPVDPLQRAGRYEAYKIPLYRENTYTIRVDGLSPDLKMALRLRIENDRGEAIATSQFKMVFHPDGSLAEPEFDPALPLEKVIESGVWGEVSFVPPVSGEYRILVIGAAGKTGEFELTVTPSHQPVVLNLQDMTTELVGDILVSTPPLPDFVDPHGGSRAASGFEHGYVERRFELLNRSTKAAHQVTLLLPAASGDGGHQRNMGLRLRKTVNLEPGEKQTVSIYQPVRIGLAGGDLSVIVDGVAKDVPYQNLSQPLGRFGRGESSIPHLLASPDLAGSVAQNAPDLGALPAMLPVAPELRDDYFGAASKRSIPGLKAGVGDVASLRGVQPLIYTSRSKFLGCRSWLGYSSYDGIVFSAKELNDLPPDMKLSLWEYVECGGTLVIAGKAAVADHWRPAKSSAAGWTVYEPGFGRCVVTEKPEPKEWTEGQWRELGTMWVRSFRAWNHLGDANRGHADFPVVENQAIPIRGLFLFMFAFVILIGPVNFFWLSRAGKRHWMLWTVPVFSLLTTGLLFGYLALTEGVRPHFRGMGITVIDENTQRASSIGWLGYYSPGSGRTLHFAMDTELSPFLDPMWEDRRYYGRGGRQEVRSLSMDQTTQQDLEGEWIVPKVPLHFMVRRNEKRLERLPIRRDGNRLIAVNGLKADIKKLMVCDRDGTYYVASNISAGAEAVLERDTVPDDLKPLSLHEKFGESWLEVGRQLAIPHNFALRPGSYLASFDDLPFLEPGIDNVQSRKAESHVLGILKETP